MSNNNQNTEYLTNAILEEMVRQLRMEQTPPPSPPPRNRHGRNNQQNRSNNNVPTTAFTGLLDTIYETVTQYNENMSDYNRNIRQTLNYLHNAQNYCISNNVAPRIGDGPINQDQHRWSGEPNTHIRFPENRNTNFSQRRQNSNRRVTSTQHTFGNNNRMFFSYAFDPSQNQNETNENSENIRPMTREEISRTTRTFSYIRDSLPEDRRTCPITMEQFQPGDVLCEILGCNHTFRRPALMNWLQRSSRCPVCRYTLNSYGTETNNTTPSTSSNNIPSTLFNISPNTSSNNIPSTSSNITPNTSSNNISSTSSNITPNTSSNNIPSTSSNTPPNTGLNNINPFGPQITTNLDPNVIPEINQFQQQLNNNISNLLNTDLLSNNPSIDLSLNISRFSIPTTSPVQPVRQQIETTETQQEEEVSDIEDNIPVD